MSSKVKADKYRGQTTYVPAGWTIGKIETEKRIVKPVMELFKRLRGTCLDEFQVMQQMRDIRFEDDKLVFSAST